MRGAVYPARIEPRPPRAPLRCVCADSSVERNRESPLLDLSLVIPFKDGDGLMKRKPTRHVLRRRADGLSDSCDGSEPQPRVHRHRVTSRRWSRVSVRILQGRLSLSGLTRLIRSDLASRPSSRCRCVRSLAQVHDRPRFASGVRSLRHLRAVLRVPMCRVVDAVRMCDTIYSGA